MRRGTYKVDQCAQLAEATAAHLAAAAPVVWIGFVRTAPYPSRCARADMDARGFSLSAGRTVQQINIRNGNCSFGDQQGRTTSTTIEYPGASQFARAVLVGSQDGIGW